jgi:hypothetical protein
MRADFVLQAGQMRVRVRFWRRAASGVLVLCSLAFASPPAAAQGTPDTQPPPSANGSAAPTIDPDRLPIDLDKIQRAIRRPPAIKLDNERAVFRIEIFGRKPTIEDILGRDFLRGPVPYGGMTHQEFLNMVTPKDVQGYAAFDNKQAFTVAATSLALQWALQKAIQKYQDAKEERARAAAKQEVEEALAELRRARRAAGLPDK